MSRDAATSALLPASCRWCRCCLIVLTSLLLIAHASAGKQSEARSWADTEAGGGREAAPPATTGHDVVYTFDNVFSLFYRDVLRWLAILEDVLSETIRAHFFNGLVDRRTIKLSLRLFAQNLVVMLREQGYFLPSPPPLVAAS